MNKQTRETSRLRWKKCLTRQRKRRGRQRLNWRKNWQNRKSWRRRQPYGDREHEIKGGPGTFFVIGASDIQEKKCAYFFIFIAQICSVWFSLLVYPNAGKLICRDCNVLFFFGLQGWKWWWWSGSVWFNLLVYLSAWERICRNCNFLKVLLQE